MASLHDIQTTELEMLVIINDVCNANDLAYSMIGGTMLGAVRHQGFIPWDDDIDLYMPIRDAKKLSKLLNHKDLFFQMPKSDIQMPYIMYKIRKNHTKMTEESTKDLQINQGIWIDIFPYCYAAKHKFAKKMQCFLRSFLQSYRCRFLHKINNDSSKRFLYSLLTRMPRSIQLFVDNFLMSLIVLCGNKKSKLYFALDPGRYSVFPCEWFDQTQDFHFEGHFFKGSIHYNEYLSTIFGNDYMIPKCWSHIPDYSDVMV